MKSVAITHSGKAHRDEFLALCVFASLDPGLTILRRDPTAEELSDSEIWCIDVGLRFEPELHNFDHHQMDPKESQTCALTLVLQHLGMYDDASNVFTWIGFTEKLDTQGPFKLAAEMGVEPDVFMTTISPIESSMLELFSQYTQLTAQDPILGIMREIGERLTNTVRDFTERYQYLQSHAETWNIGKFQALFVPRNDITVESPALAVDALRRDTDQDIACSIVPDDRGDGYALFRFDDDPRIDFAKLEGADQVIFAHKGGFIAKVASAGQQTLTGLIQAATVE